MGRVLLSTGCLLLVAFMLVSGCTKKSTEDSAQKSDDTEQAETNIDSPSVAADKGSDVQTADGVYRNSDGDIFCPVMQIVIESPELAAASVEHEGVTYYFSTEAAAELFKEDPGSFTG